ncbi:hypothetical protein GCM10011297_02470 [Bacterioplanes sanyensis]|uniref:DUF2058 domain-containing protein n=1 Tax=Bacterioplanes sanyensis TaxID=1249553 RepID=UPI0016751B93|nr:DUF2058 domain-containing protein [Bacterioplanes sanyensis]GGY33030.1 hypothetical protein GCM10011297_02470 [Bacterioplanes sanyensis]
MAKSLQEQLLASGLVNNKKAKQAQREKKRQQHLQRTGKEDIVDEAKINAEQARKQKAERDRELNRQREQQAHKKAIAAQIRQLVASNAIVSERADVRYQFVGPDKKVKPLHVDQAVFDRLSRGQLAIMELDNSFAVIPVPVTEKIRQRDSDIFIYIADAKADQLDEDDPYAAYQIPDDLMW